MTSVKDKILLTGGADGKVSTRWLEIWELIREIEETCDAVYDMAFQEYVVGEGIVAVAGRNGRVIFDVI